MKNTPKGVFFLLLLSFNFDDVMMLFFLSGLKVSRKYFKISNKGVRHFSVWNRKI